SAKAIVTSPELLGWRRLLVRLTTEPALNLAGGATGATFRIRSDLPDRLMRCSSGTSGLTPFPAKATRPRPGTVTPPPVMDPVDRLESTKGSVASCTEPAPACST